MSYRKHYEDMPSEEIQRRVRELDLASDQFLRGTTALYDPIFTTLFTAVFQTAFGFSAATAGILGSATAAIAVTAVSPGLQRFS